MPIDIVSPFQAGLAAGTLNRKRKRENAFAEILAKAYEPASGDKPARFNVQNAFADMAQGGFAPEALELQQKNEDREIQRQRLTKGPDSPNAVREWEYFKSISPEDQMKYLNLKRQSYEVTDVGGVPTLVSRQPGVAQTPLSSLEKETKGKTTIAEGKGYGTKVGSDTAEIDVKQNESAIASAENITKIDNLLNHLRTSDAITGMGADILKNIERAKVLVSNSERAGKKVSDTELLDVMMGSEVFPMIGALGIGARGLDTPAEREFLRQVMTGSIPMNKQTLIRMTELRRNVAERAIERWNKRVESGELDRYFDITGRPKQKIEAPKTSTPYISGVKSKRNVGDIVQTRQGPMIIERINPDGSYEARPAR